MKDYTKYKYAHTITDEMLNIKLTNTAPTRYWGDSIINQEILIDDTGLVISGKEMIWRSVMDDRYANEKELKWLLKDAYEMVVVNKYIMFNKLLGNKTIKKAKFKKKSYHQLSTKTKKYYKHTSNFIVTIIDEKTK